MRTSRRVALACAAASGVLLVASGEPFALGPLAWIALVPLLWAVNRVRRARLAALCGFVTGLVYFGIHIEWIFHFGWMAWAGLTAYMAATYAASAWLSKVFSRFPLATPLVAASWTALELFRDHLPWGGFSWGALGTSQASVPGVRSLAAVIGVYGLSFLIAFVAATIADRLVIGHLAWGSVVLVGVALLTFVVVDAFAYGGRAPGRPFTVTVVQGNVPRPVVAYQDERVFESHVRLTEQLIGGPRSDVVVWPEAAIGVDTPPGAMDRVSELARALGTPILTGHSEAVFDDLEFFNLVQQIDVNGLLQATYQKRHPVPFGEYVPVKLLRRFVRTLGQVAFDMLPGRRVVLFDIGGVKVATPICFESVFPRDVRDFARAGADVIVVSTNDSSFERSFAARQHLAHARMRALETRQWVVQAALSGITAVVSPDGRVSQATKIFRPAIVRAHVRARPARSLYVRFGDLFAACWVAGAAVALALYAFVSLWAIGLQGRRR